MPRSITTDLHWLEKAAADWHRAIHGYVLMTNHVHLLVTPETETGTAKLRQAVGWRYVQNDQKFTHLPSLMVLVMPRMVTACTGCQGICIEYEGKGLPAKRDSRQPYIIYGWPEILSDTDIQIEVITGRINGAQHQKSRAVI
jgi:hypothetical protein